jgi:small subunit ribosomal protein S21
LQDSAGTDSRRAVRRFQRGTHASVPISTKPSVLGVALILVTVRDNEPFEKALRRFRRKVEREGIRKDIKKNSFYLKPGEKRRLKQRLAEKRRRKALRRAIKKAAMGR